MISLFCDLQACPTLPVTEADMNPYAEHHLSILPWLALLPSVALSLCEIKVILVLCR